MDIVTIHQYLYHQYETFRLVIQEPIQKYCGEFKTTAALLNQGKKFQNKEKPFLGNYLEQVSLKK